MPHNLLMRSKHQTDGLMQERRNSIANAVELCLSCTNPSRCFFFMSSEYDFCYTFVTAICIQYHIMIGHTITRPDLLPLITLK